MLKYIHVWIVWDYLLRNINVCGIIIDNTCFLGFATIRKNAYLTRTKTIWSATTILISEVCLVWENKVIKLLIKIFLLDFSAKLFVKELLTTGDQVSCDETNDEFDRNNKLPPFYDEELFKR